MTKRAAIYARVSTDDQAENGYSLPSQIDACLLFAENLDYSVTIKMTEDYSGATPLAERPQGAWLVDMVKRREVDAVIIYQVDRLSRDIVNLLATVQTWLRAGVEIYSLDVGKIESELDIVLVIKGWQGSDERTKIRERSMRGKRAKAKAGKVVGTRPPYGYKHVRGENGKVITLEPVDERAQIIRLIYRWYVFGDENGKKLTVCTIARRLSEMGVSTPGESSKGYIRKRGAGMWHRSAVLSILSHEVYAGLWHFGVKIGGSRNERPREEWIAVNVPAIIEREVWELAQAQRGRNSELSRRNAKRDYLLSGYIRCACGWSMSGRVYHHNYRYYECTLRNNRYAKLEKQVCNVRAVRADAIEPAVWESIVQLFTNEIELERLLRIAQREELEALDPKQDEYTAIQGMMIDSEREAAEIGQALRRASGIVTKSLEKDMQEVNRRYDALCKRCEILQQELSKARLTDNAIQEALQFAEDIRAGIQNADFETKRRNLELLQVRVIVDGRRFYITCLAGAWEGEISELSKVAIETDLHLPISHNYNYKLSPLLVDLLSKADKGKYIA
jgi:site-specific DNA recombinase